MSALPMPTGGVSPFRRPMIDDDFLENPYPTYQVLRDAGPTHWSDEFFGGAWLLTRHEDVEAMLRDPRFSARRTGGWVMNSGEGARNELKGFQQLFARAMLFLDAPDHPRIRRVLHAVCIAIADRFAAVEVRICGKRQPPDASVLSAIPTA